jgi:AdoMet-dependent heme synthase
MELLARAAFDFGEKPFIVIWEVTQACDLACAHCRASAQPLRSCDELSTEEGKHLIDEIADFKVPVFVITGGDPLKRPDIFELVQHASSRGVRVSMTPSATPLLTQEAVHKLKDAGLARMAISLDGSTAMMHDTFRGVVGSYQRTLEAVGWARQCGLPVQINTTFSRYNIGDLDNIAALMKTLDISLWSVFFLVPMGRGQMKDLLSAEEFEAVFAKLHALAKDASFDIKSTEAQHYRRYILQHKSEGLAVAKRPAGTDHIGRAPRGLNDGKGFAFISHKGDVYPSGFLPVSGGNVRQRSLASIYRESPLFLKLRDADALGGKCGVCEFRQVCGGSRARAFAVSGDYLAEEPCCVYEPKAKPKPMPPRLRVLQDTSIESESKRIGR